MNITEKGKWKYIPIEKRYFDDNAFDGFGSIQVLTDYVYTTDVNMEKALGSSSRKENKGKVTQAAQRKSNFKDEKAFAENGKRKKSKEKISANIMAKSDHEAKKGKGKDKKMVVTDLKPKEFTDMVENKTTCSQEELDPNTIKMNRLERKKIKRKAKKAAAIARKKEAAVQGIAVKELSISTKTSNQNIKQLNVSHEAEGKAMNTKQQNQEMKGNQKNKKMVVTALKTKEFTEIIKDKTSGSQEELDPSCIKANRLERKKLKRKAKKAAAVARKKSAAAQGIAMKELSISTKTTNQNIKQLNGSQEAEGKNVNTKQQNKAVKRNQKDKKMVVTDLKTKECTEIVKDKPTGLQEELDPSTIKANRLERKKIKRKAKKAAAIARKKEAAAQGIAVKELNISSKTTNQNIKQLNVSQEAEGKNVNTKQQNQAVEENQKTNKMVVIDLKTKEFTEIVKDKPTVLQEELDPSTVKANRLERKRIKRKAKKAAAVARKKEAAAQGIAVKELNISTKTTNQNIKQLNGSQEAEGKNMNAKQQNQAVEGNQKTNKIVVTDLKTKEFTKIVKDKTTVSQEDLDPSTIKANRLERKRIKRKAKKAAAVARKKEAAAQGINIKELKITTKTTNQNIKQINKSQETEEKNINTKQQKKKNRKLAQQNRRATVQSSIIDITDIDKFVDPATLEEANKSQTKKRKLDDIDGPKKQPKNKKKKTGKTKSTEGIKPKAPEQKMLPKKKAVNMSKWKELFVPEVVLKALSEVGFDAPTPIQCLTLPAAIRDRQDILGAAETGSGKTLAFGIPVIHNILEYKAAHPDGALDIGNDDSSEDDWDSGGKEMVKAGDGRWGEGGRACESEERSSENGDGGSDLGEAEIWGGDRENEEGLNSSGDAEDVESMDDKGEESDAEGGDQSEDDADRCDQSGGDQSEHTVVEEESDDGGDYDLAPEDGEEYFELKDGELGCLAAVNNVSFDWMEEDGMETVDLADVPAPAIGGHWRRPLHCLILTPTRELAIQIKNHLQTACAHTDIKICCVVGGMASQKQERILRKCPEIVVATPGRFWELLQQGEPHLAKVNRLGALVIDEADRMVEKGHFEEMKRFMEFLKENEKNRKRRQNFVFSATLMMIHKAPTRLLLKKKKVKQQTTDDKLQSLVEMIGLDPKAKVIDITRKLGTAEGLVESKINCTSEEKDIYLYYFLQRYPGRTLVFSNSKDCLRRLVSIFTLLDCKPLPLHADMHQRQRLKNLDKFKADPTGLLLATDVAARGLDIPDVEHVIHYQVPRTSENYVHRSGRTARACKEGLSVVLIGPDDMTNYKMITRTLNRSEELGVFPVEQEFMVAMRQRVGLACKIDKEEHKNIKSKKQNMWFEKAAREMDIELDKEGLLNDLGDSQQQAQQKQRIMSMRRDLRTLLSQPVVSRAFSGRYPTKMGKLDMPLNTSSESGGACAAARKEATSSSRFHISNTSEAPKTAKRARKKKYKRKK